MAGIEELRERVALTPLPRCALKKSTPKKVRSLERIALLIAIFLLTLTSVRSLAALPQSKGNATLSGVVLGPDDRPVAHASVSYQSSDGRGPHVVRADSRGHFTISKLRADVYDLHASGKGVFSDWEKNIALRPGQTKTVTLRLIYAKEIPNAYVKAKPNH